MLSRTAIFLLLALLHVKAAARQDCTHRLTGRVINESGQPVAGAAVFLDKTRLGTSADASGIFHFDALCKGDYTVTIHYLGYRDLEARVPVDGETNRTFIIEGDVHELREVVIEDQFINIDHSHNTQSLNESELAAHAGKPLGETLKEITGVNAIQSGPGIFKPVIHGVHSQRVLILNYGVRQEGQQWGAEHAPEIDPFIASDIIVIKDASSIKYGTDALGGVIVVNPPPLPHDHNLGGTLNTVFQSNNRSVATSGMLEGGVKAFPGWGWRVQGTAKQGGDFHAPAYVLSNTGSRELNFSAATGYHRERFGVEIFFSRFSGSLGILKGTAVSNVEDLVSAMERDVPLYTTRFTYSISEPRQSVTHDLMKVNAHVETTRGEWRFQYGLQNNRRKEFDIRRGALSSVPSIDLQLFTHSLESEWETYFTEQQSLCVGVTALLQQNNNVPGTQRIPFIPDYDNASGGVFSIFKILRTRWTADIGARYDFRNYRVVGFDFKNALYRSDLAFHNASITSGATFQLSRNATLSTNLSTAWRPPHVAELYSLGTHQSAAAIEYGLLLHDSTNEVMNIAQTSFRVERAVKWVNTLRRNWKRFQLEAGGYVNYIPNYTYLRPHGITRNVRGVYPYFRYEQTDALFLGADLAAIWTVTERWHIIPKASLLRATDVANDDVFVYIPSNRYELNFRFEEPKKFKLLGFFAEARVRYTATQGRAPRTITARQWVEAAENGEDPVEDLDRNFDFMDAPAAFWIVTASTGFNVPLGDTRLDMRLSADNLLNTRYREYTNRFRYFADEPGRNISVSLKCIF